jgi:hypothetical protein
VSNGTRQEFAAEHLSRNKAEALVETYRAKHPGLRLVAHPVYVTAENVLEAVRNAALICVCADNHPVRVLVDQAAAERPDICVLSAGNEKFDGNVCVTLRRGGRYLTAPFTERHPETIKAKRGDRATLGCEARIERGETQLLVTNFTAAAAVLCAFHALWTGGKRVGKPRLPPPQEVYFDAAACAMSAVPAVKAKEGEKHERLSA